MTTKIHKFSAPGPVPEPPADRLIQEKQVLSYRPMLSRSILLAARRQGIITWTEGKQGSAWYRLADVDDFLKREKEFRCQDPGRKPCSNSTANGSGGKSESHSSTGTGMMRPLDIAVAQASARRILGKQSGA